MGTSRTKLVGIAATVVVAVALMSGCSTVDKKLSASADAAFSPEDLTTWARPVEISFELGDDIEGEASYQVILGVFRTGEVPGSAAGGLLSASTMILGNITGQQAQNPEIGTAAFNAADSVDADGIFVTNVEIVEDKFLWLYKKRTITVQGKALSIVNLGQVDEARADNARYLRLLPSGGVSLPEDTGGQTWLPVRP